MLVGVSKQEVTYFVEEFENFEDVKDEVDVEKRLSRTRGSFTLQ